MSAAETVGTCYSLQVCVRGPCGSVRAGAMMCAQRPRAQAVQWAVCCASALQQAASPAQRRRRLGGGGADRRRAPGTGRISSEGNEQQTKRAENGCSDSCAHVAYRQPVAQPWQ
ncbi:hypothetical protein ACN47E_005397 [Coniothyrium glycines]